MNNPSRTTNWLAWGGLGAVITVISGLFLVNQLKPAAAPLPVYGRIADFALTNQNAAPVTLADLRGKVWLADIIFTRCPGPCARMTKQMRELQQALPAASAAQLVSLTTDADFDTPPVLQQYAARFGAAPGNWLFLTGDKRTIANLAIDSLKLTALEKPAAERTSAEDLFVHSTIFVLVDKQARLRGVFETGGEDIDWKKSKADILAAVKLLEREP